MPLTTMPAAKLPRQKPMTVCEICGEVLQRSSLGRHRQRRHGAPTASIRDVAFVPTTTFKTGKYTSYSPSPNKRRKESSAAPSTSSSTDSSDERVETDFEEVEGHFSIDQEPKDLKPLEPISRDLFACTYCPSTFTWKSNLRRHERVVHHIVNDAHEEDRTPSQILEHINKRFQCDECTASYTELGNLRRHQREKHNRPKGLIRRGPVDLGGAIPFDEPLPLMDDGLPWLRKYTCAECGLSYSTSEELDVHDARRHAHLRGSEFDCSLCPATFATAERRQKHESLHIMQPMQQCGVCPSKFYRASMLEFHMLQEHDTLADLDQFDIVEK